MFETVFKALMEGFGESLKIFALTLIGALPLGLIIAFGSMSKFSPLKYFTRAIVWIIRGTPLMLQLIIIFYGPGLILGTNIWGIGSKGRFIAVIVAFVLNYGCYFSEIYRGGIEGISQGQYEAGQVLGMNKGQIFFRIVLPQVFKRIIPPMSNEIITLVKDTSLARVIGVYELIHFGEAFIKSNGLIWPLFFTGVFYLVFSGILTLLFCYIEKKLNYYRV